MKAWLTQQEATFWLAVSARYGAAQFGPDGKRLDPPGTEWAEVVRREQSVLGLWKLLRKAATKVKDSYRFGPEDADENWTVELNLHDDDRDGVLLVALQLLDPRSNLKVQVSIADDVVWPVLKKVGRVRAVRKELKLDETKPRRYEDDPETEPKLKKVEDEIVPESEPEAVKA